MSKKIQVANSRKNDYTKRSFLGPFAKFLVSSSSAFGTVVRHHILFTLYLQEEPAKAEGDTRSGHSSTVPSFGPLPPAVPKADDKEIGRTCAFVFAFAAALEHTTCVYFVAIMVQRDGGVADIESV